MLYADCVNNDRLSLKLSRGNESVITHRENVEIYYHDWPFNLKINGGLLNVQRLTVRWYITVKLCYRSIHENFTLYYG